MVEDYGGPPPPPQSPSSKQSKRPSSETSAASPRAAPKSPRTAPKSPRTAPKSPRSSDSPRTVPRKRVSVSDASGRGTPRGGRGRGRSRGNREGRGRGGRGRGRGRGRSVDGRGRGRGRGRARGSGRDGRGRSRGERGQSVRKPASEKSRSTNGTAPPSSKSLRSVNGSVKEGMSFKSRSADGMVKHNSTSNSGNGSSKSGWFFRSGSSNSSRRSIMEQFNDEDSLGFKEPPKAIILVWLFVAGELVLDLVSTVISFKALVENGFCCGRLIDLGRLPLGITIPFFFLILIELGILAYSIKITLFPPRKDDIDEEMQDLQGEEDVHQKHEKHSSMVFTIINLLVLANPFFGFMVAWMLLYQSSKRECFAVLGLEAAALLLHWLGVYFEGKKQTKLQILIHLLPAIPFGVTVIVVLVYLNEGGVCYLVQDSLFWYEGCQVCGDDKYPAREDGTCPGGEEAYQDTYCGEKQQFCFFRY